MKIFATFTVFTLLFCFSVPSQSQQGAVCIAPLDNLSQKFVQGVRGVSVRIDKGDPILLPQKEGVKIAGLDVSQRHLVVLYAGKTRLESFWFRFSTYDSNDLCLAYDGYESVQLRGRKHSPWCKCK